MCGKEDMETFRVDLFIDLKNGEIGLLDVMDIHRPERFIVITGTRANTIAVARSS